MQQMGSRVVEGGTTLLLHIYTTSGSIPNPHHITTKFANVHNDSGPKFLGISNHKLGIFQLQHTGITNLSTRFRIECSTIQHHHALLAVPEGVHRCIILDNCNYCGILFLAVITNKVSVSFQRDCRLIHGHKLAGSTGTVTLCVHFPLEAIHIQGQFSFPGDIRCKVNRKSEGVIQLECSPTSDLSTIHISNGLIQNLHALFQGFSKTLLFQQ